MNFRLGLAILAGKFISVGSRLFNIGAGSTWGGEMALRIEPRLIRKIVREFWPRTTWGAGVGIVLVGGTNGKTTTVKMIRSLFEDNPQGRLSSIKVFSNEAGANLLNGIAGTLVREFGVFRGFGEEKIGVFEVDETTLPLALREFTPKVVVILNLFRDQLDRYGEVNIVAAKWHQALEKLPRETTVILNADDPRVAYLGEKLKAKVRYFGFEDFEVEPRRGSTSVKADTWGDSLYCPKCAQRLIFKKIYFSHLGDWKCEKCGLKRPQVDYQAEKVKIPLTGRFNLYNGAAAILTVREFREFREVFRGFRGAFGRGEEIEIQGSRFKVQGMRKVRILLAKNPTGFNENIYLIKSQIPSSKSQMVRQAHHPNHPERSRGTNSNFQNSKFTTILLVLNDRIPDGRDVSWIWDVDFEPLFKSGIRVIVSGERAEDMGLRLKYTNMQTSKYYESISNFKIQISNNLRKAVKEGLRGVTGGKGILYVLANYSAMLEVRKILVGRGIG